MSASLAKASEALLRSEMTRWAKNGSEQRLAAVIEIGRLRSDMQSLEAKYPNDGPYRIHASRARMLAALIDRDWVALQYVAKGQTRTFTCYSITLSARPSIMAGMFRPSKNLIPVSR
jgi:hypothetical protein